MVAAGIGAFILPAGAPAPLRAAPLRRLRCAGPAAPFRPPDSSPAAVASARRRDGFTTRHLLM